MTGDRPADRAAGGRSGSGLADEADSGAIRAIYNHEVEHSTATFDLVPRSPREQRDWLANRSGAFSAIVAAEWDGEVVGFASVSPYKERAAYRTTVEDSVYVRRDRHGLGIGKAAALPLLDAAEASGFHAVMARIEAGGDGVPGAARGVRLPPDRDRAGGGPEVQPLAGHRPHAVPPAGAAPLSGPVREPAWTVPARSSRRARCRGAPPPGRPWGR